MKLSLRVSRLVRDGFVKWSLQVSRLVRRLQISEMVL